MKRRDFTKLAVCSVAAIGYPLTSTVASDSSSKPLGGSNVPLGLCDWSLHAWKWKAQQHLDFAIQHRLDAILFNSHGVFEQTDDEYLKRFQERAAAHGITIYMGVGSITNENARFVKQFGSPEALLAEGIRMAAEVGSPVVSCRIGSIKDRYTEDGIRPKIDKAVRVMKALREPALEAGIRFAFENHAGDLRTNELIELIGETGTDICGALFDPANAAWAMEDPMASLRELGSRIICTSVRDFMVWETDEGAAFQCTSVGKGLMDFDLVVQHLAEHCPGVPLHIETVSGGVTRIPYLEPEFWNGFREVRAEELVGFFRLLKRGHQVEIQQASSDADREVFRKEFQKTEFLSSLAVLRNQYGAGVKRSS